MRILTVPDDTGMLRLKSTPMNIIDRTTIEFLKNLGETLKGLRKPAGVGLSAVQVGRPIRIFASLLSTEKRVTRVGTPAHPDFGGIDPGCNERQDPRSQKPKLLFYINPEILAHSNNMTLGEDLVDQDEPSDLHPSSFSLRPFLEGCLSIPHLYGPVKRWEWIKAKATILSESNLSSSSSLFPLPSSFTLDALASRVFQHELDHLDGILFTDRTIAEGNQLYRETNKEFIPVDI